MTTQDSFLQETRDTLRRKHLSIRTEQAYLSTIKRFLDFHGRSVFDQPLGDLGDLSPAPRTRRLPVVLSPQEAQDILAAMRGTDPLMAELPYTQ